MRVRLFWKIFGLYLFKQNCIKKFYQFRVHQIMDFAHNYYLYLIKLVGNIAQSNLFMHLNKKS